MYQLPDEGRKTVMSDLPSPSMSPVLLRPDWKIVTISPAMVSVAVREAGPPFAATANVTTPEPAPLEPAVIVTNAGLLLEALHPPQKSGRLTDTLPVP